MCPHVAQTLGGVEAGSGVCVCVCVCVCVYLMQRAVVGLDMSHVLPVLASEKDQHTSHC